MIDSIANAVYVPNGNIKRLSFFPKNTIPTIPITIKLGSNNKPTESSSNTINYTLELQPVTHRLESLSSQLDSKTLFNVFSLVREIIKESKGNLLLWSTPLINVNYDSDVVLEWWNKNKKLTFYINQSSIDYMKVWGADIDTEMEDGSLDSMRDGSIGRLWQWISH
jgi:hypothetical protein